jgi:hypothetical protein
MHAFSFSPFFSDFRPQSLRLRQAAIACVAFAALPALTGCAALQVKMGMKVYLAKTPIATMEVVQQGAPGIAPGKKSSLVVLFTQPGGMALQSEGAGGGKVMWRDLVVTSTVVSVTPKGVISLPRDPRKTDRQMPHVTVTAPSHPELRADLDIPLRYDIAYNSNFSGSDGTKGVDGTSGLDGGNGSDGGNGGDGQNGWPGGDAPPVQIDVAFRAGDHPLLQVGVFAPGHKRYYLIDPQGGSLSVRADGGSGGKGGSGGRAGRGGSGGIGSPNGNSGLDGHAGMDGHDGSDGRGGLITVTCDPEAMPYLDRILHLSSRNGPRPVYQQAPVAPLW